MIKIIKYLLSPLISLVVLAFLISKFDVKELQMIFQNSNAVILIITTAVFFITTPALSALRWKTILKTINCEISFYEAIKFYLASLPLAKITPANSGDFIRTYYLRKKLEPSLNAGGIILERMLDFFILAMFALFFGITTNNKTAMAAGALFIIVITGFLFFGKKINIAKIEKILYIFRIISKHPTAMAIAASYTILLWFVIISYIKFIFIAIGANISFWSILAIQPVVIFFSLAPFTISGIGVRESAMVFLYAGLASDQTVFLTGLTYSLFGGICLPAIGIPFLYNQFKFAKNHGK